MYALMAALCLASSYWLWRWLRAPGRRACLATSAGLLAAALLEHREEREHALQIVVHSLPVAAQVRAHAQVVENCHRPEDHAALGHMAEAAGDDAVGGGAGDVLAVEGDPAGFRPQQAGDGAQGGIGCAGDHQ